MEGYSLEEAIALPNEMFLSIIEQHKPRSSTHTGKRYAVLDAQFVCYCTELKKTGFTITGITTNTAPTQENIQGQERSCNPNWAGEQKLTWVMLYT